MQTIGLIGGITPQSTIMYYQVLNDLASKEFGSMHSCKVIMNSLDFGEISSLQVEGRWDLLDVIMQDAAKSLERAGASVIVICANTMHLCVTAIEKVVKIPVIHIAEATAKKVRGQEISKVALLGTRYTMEKPFFKDILENSRIETIIPQDDEREIIHRVIYEELSKGLLLNKSKEDYIKVIRSLIERGAEGIILGCTEIPLLIHQDDVSVPVFDTTTIHATEAFNYSINKVFV
ncbi:MAG: aspartate racemase [Bacteroidetes bacterium]|nr:MAG: aspartate racemase [Bacteroidota bacterium]